MNDEDRSSLRLLMAGFAHEMNTPLGAIQSNRDVLRRAVAKINEIVDDGVVDKDEIEQIRDLSKHLGEILEIDQVAVEMIAELVASARSCWQLDDSEMRCVDIHDGIESTLLMLRHQLKKRIEIVKQYGELPGVTCYPSQTNQVFMNLLLNAFQAIEGEGTITIRTYRRNGQVVVEISDTGSGIAPEHLQRIFEAGFTTKGTKSGMGLGLRICREIIEQQGGAIEAESKVGQGSTFRVFLPIDRERGRSD